MEEQGMLAAEQLYSLSLLIAIAIAITWIAWRGRFFQMAPGLSPVRISFAQVVAAFAIYLGMQLGAASLVQLFLKLLQKHQLDLRDLVAYQVLQGWCNIAIVLLSSLALALFAFFYIEPLSLQKLWGKQEKKGFFFLKQISIGAASWFIAYPMVMAIAQLVSLLISLEFPSSHLDQVAVKQLKGTEASPLLFGATAFIIISLIPIVEEFLFRGLLQTWIKRKLGAYWAIALTAMIFALFHYSSSQGITNLELFVALFILACYLGFLFEKQQSLWASIGLHATFNALSIIMILMG